MSARDVTAGDVTAGDVTTRGERRRLTLDAERRSVFLGGRPVALTAKEFTLFELFFTARGRLFGRDDILGRVWGLDFPGEARVVDAYVKRLRAKLGAETIETVRGLGYRCPLPETGGVAQPHLQRLPREARLLTRLAERILRVTDPAHIVSSVHELLLEHYAVREVSLWTVPGSGPGQSLSQPSLSQPSLSQPSLPQPAEQGPLLLAHAGLARATALPPEAVNTALGAGSGLKTGSGRPADPGRDAGPLPPLLVPLGRAGHESPWAVLAFWDGAGRHDWPLDVQSALGAVAGLVHPALRLNAEIGRRQQAESQVRALNADLERRVQARTHDLARANTDLGALYALAQGLAGAGSLAEVLAHGLSLMAQMSGAGVCSLWRLHSTELHCLGAYTPGHEDRSLELAREAGAIAGLLRQSVACAPAQGDPARQIHGGLSRTATTDAGRQALLIPLAITLSEVHALHFELPGELPGDLSLLEAAARAFGLAFERQTQTLTLEQVALSDELTGLPNRRALLADLAAELSYSQRHRTSLTLSLFELPGIRSVNQGQGFAAGNDLIRELADDLLAALRLEDRVYRLGGAVLVSLVRTRHIHERQVLQARLNRLTGAAPWPASPVFPASDIPVSGSPVSGIAASGSPASRLRAAGALTVSHASAPDDTSELSGLLHLALQRLDLQHRHPDSGAARPGPEAGA